MAIKIIIDSASDFTYEEAQKLGLEFLPLTVSFGDKEYRDGIDLSKIEFYEKLEEFDGMPKTSQVTPAQYMEVFKKYSDTDDDLLVLTVSSRVSGTNTSCEVAAVEMNSKKIYIVDTKSVSIGYKILVQYAMELVNQGKNIAEIVELLKEKREKIKIFFLLDTLEYVHKGGRVSSLASIAGAILSVKPILTIKDGLVVMEAKSRGLKKGVAALTECVIKSGDIDHEMPFALAYSGTDRTLLDLIIKANIDKFERTITDDHITMMGSTIGTHSGPGAVGIAFFVK